MGAGDSICISPMGDRNPALLPLVCALADSWSREWSQNLGIRMWDLGVLTVGSNVGTMLFFFSF